MNTSLSFVESSANRSSHLSRRNTEVRLSSNSMRQLQRDRTKPAARGAATAEVLKPVLQACQRRIRSWWVPPNWSPIDWFEEIEAVETIAAWQAVCLYDASAGIKCEAFVYQKIMAHALTRYRQEWTYALRCISTDECTNFARSSNGASDAAGSTRRDIHLVTTSVNTAAPIFEDLDDALRTLSGAQHRLIKKIFWHGQTEDKIGKELGISQRAVSKRKHVILESLRDRLSAESPRSTKNLELGYAR
jgi:RNA polymerase sigma factor (sigma-70 family)